jgi:thioredoxin 1
MSDKIVLLTDDNFQREVMDSKIPVLVDFYADWCAPCRKVAPIIEELADEYAGKLKVCKLDVDVNTKVTKDYQIRSIPAVKIFVNGEEVENKTGCAAKEVYSQIIDSHI